MGGEPALQRGGELGGDRFEVVPRRHEPILATHNGVVAIREPVDDLYAELGVARTATRDEIAAAFRPAPGTSIPTPTRATTRRASGSSG